MKKIIIIINCIFACLILVLDGIYIGLGELWQKAVASLLFVALGGANLYFAFRTKADKRKFSIVLFVGLVFAMLGDIVLNPHFISGAVLFAVGHVFFFISYSFLHKFSSKDLVYGFAIFVPSLLFIVLAPIFDFGGVLMEIVCIVYALIISLMVGKALANLVHERSLLTVIIFVGSVLFFISDLMLLLNVFGGLPKIIDILCLATYYPAEILLASSVLSSSISAKTFVKDK